MATPHDALFFREAFGRTLKNRTTGFEQAYFVTPLTEYEEKTFDIRDTEMRKRIEAVRNALIDTIDNGDIFYVSSEISHMLYEQALQIPDEQLLHFEPGDFPTRTGYVYFDGNVPLPTVLSRDGQQPLRAMLWTQLLSGPKNEFDQPTWMVPGSDTGNTTEVIGKVLYTVVDNPQRWLNRTVEKAMEDKIHVGRWVTRHWFPLEYDVRMTGSHAADMINETDASYLTDEQREQDVQDMRDTIALVTKLLWVWCAFLQTEIYGHAGFDSSQHDKVLSREGRPPAKIRIVTLRRYAASHDPDHNFIDVNWTHRWKVREHYRNQRVGPGRMFIRRTLVHEHTKGPLDKPLAEQDTVQAIVR